MKQRIFFTIGIAWITTVFFFASMVGLIVLKTDQSAYWGGLTAEMAERIMLDKGDPMGPYIAGIGAGTILFGMLATVSWSRGEGQPLN